MRGKTFSLPVTRVHCYCIDQTEILGRLPPTHRVCFSPKLLLSDGWDPDMWTQPVPSEEING